MPIVLIHMGDAVKINCDCSLAGSYECSNMDNSCYLSANYLKGKDKPNYPVPAIRAMVNNAQRLIDFGNISAENGFDIATVFERYVKL